MTKREIGELGNAKMKWEITFLFSVCIVYNAEKIFFSGDYRYPRFFKTCSEAKCKKREKFMIKI